MSSRSFLQLIIVGADGADGAECSDGAGGSVPSHTECHLTDRWLGDEYRVVRRRRRK